MNEAIKVFREYYPEYVLNEPVYIGQGSYAIRFYVARLEKKPDSKGSSAWIAEILSSRRRVELLLTPYLSRPRQCP